MSDDIALRVRKIIADKTELDLEKITLDATPEALGIDSMRMVDIIFELEEDFDQTIPFNANAQDPSEFSMSKVGDVVDWMTKLSEENAG